MSSSNRYNIPAKRVRVETVIEKSVFITTVERARSPEEAKHFVEAMKSEFPDATHNCWAFATGVPGDTNFVGASDDGEPSGTAGQPMLKVLLHSNIGEIVAVVTRYFGGIKLGTGGLVRAYTGAVQAALQELEITEYICYLEGEIEVDYSDHQLVQRFLAETSAVVDGESFTDRVRIQVRIPDDELEAFRAALVDRTHGRTSLVMG